MPPRRTKLATLVLPLVIALAVLGSPAASAAQPQPSISGFSPASGVVGTSVQISGSEFQGINSVTFNGTPATTFSVDSHTLITATVPSGATTGRIDVTRPGASATSATDFTVISSTPSISGFTPTSGTVGTSVQISGSGFLGVDSVTFNGTAATFVVNSAVLITATVPSGATTGPIRVAQGTASSTSATSFTVLPSPPSISGFTPTSGTVGTSVQISGSGFLGVDSVTFNGTAATFVVNSAVLITATVPSGATTGPIRVARGTASSTSATNFTVVTSNSDLTLAVTESADPVIADSTLTYTLSVSNVGTTSADNTSLIDTLPPEVIFQSASGGGTYNASAGTVSWNLGSVGPGTKVPLTLTIQPIHPEFPMTNSASVTTSSADPGSPNTVTTDTEIDPQPGTHYVSVSDAGSTPFYRGLTLGETIQWDFLGPSAHQITDSHGLGYLNTGLHGPISFSRFTFNLSAELRTKDLDAFPLNLGKITIPPRVSPSTGTSATSFLVVWALQQPPPNIVEDVQIKRPGATWVHWRHRQAVLIQDQFVPDAGPGTYAFRSRIRNVSNATHSRFGPPVTITVS